MTPYYAIIRTNGQVNFFDRKPSLNELKLAVGGHVEVVPVQTDQFTAYCNEEGKLNGLRMNYPATVFCGLRGDVLVGDVVIIGPPDENGDDTPLPYLVVDTLRVAVVRDIFSV